MKKIIILSTMLASLSAFAGGGFTWLSGISHSLHLPEHTVTLLVMCVLFLVMGLVYKAKTSNIDAAVIPDKGISFRNIYEFFGEFIYNLGKSTMGEKEGREYFGFFMLYFLLIFMCNLIGLIPGFLPPTENFNTGFGFGILVFIYYNYHGIRVQGFKGHMQHLMGPILFMAPLIFVLEVISHAMRPITLGLRIRGNMMGDHTVLAIFSELVPYIVPIPFYVLGLFVCFMQAFVFTILSMIYLGMAVETHDHGDHAH
ncbi:MAG: F0F1 ATP synthase subunit A [Bacteriovoracaceae bacterium]|jgi:F-type H+-transporting ATPase subunit a|nr:F0F1 ATP synthase subunit A [Bacteriovoracaceae bacterium]